VLLLLLRLLVLSQYSQLVVLLTKVDTILSQLLKMHIAANLEAEY
jgi:hypothetical protein